MNWLTFEIILFSGIATVLFITLFWIFIKRFFKERTKESDVLLIGGPAIALTFFIVMLAFPYPSYMLRRCLLSIFILGLADDFFNLKPTIKLVVELVVALALVSDGIVLHLIGIFPIDCILTIGWIVFMTNAFNLSDNMDMSLCSIVFTTSLMIILLLNPDKQITTICYCMIGCMLGFWPYNIKPARVYLGDSGSLFLGFLFSYISIIVGNKYTGIDRGLMPIFLLFTPFVDTIFVMITRTLKGKSIFRGGKDHLSHNFKFHFYNSVSMSILILSFITFIGIINVKLNNKLLMLWTAVCISLLIIGIYKKNNSVRRI